MPTPDAAGELPTGSSWVIPVMVTVTDVPGVPVPVLSCRVADMSVWVESAAALPGSTYLAVTLLLWLTATFLIARIAVALTRFSFARKTQRPPPKLLGDIISGAIWATAFCVIAVVEFGVSPTAAAATSGVVIAVVGFAIRSLVADLFYGLTMAIDRPFEIGDWVELSDGSIGQVVEMTWRAHCRGARIREVPILFEDRRVGDSKMSRGIFLEAVWRVPAYSVNSSMTS